MLMLKNSYCIAEGILSKGLCDLTLSELDWSKSADGVIVDGKPLVDADYRRTDVLWQPPTDSLGCIVRTHIDMANTSAEWGFSLVGQEDTQFARYRSDNLGYYNWHVDTEPPKEFGGFQRKLTCVILLNDPSEFEGGCLEFEGAEGKPILTKQGSIVVFPSFIKHRVTPVTKGVRYSATAWAYGPAFR